ncbi:hypothetical protein [Streptomyces tagetis]|uniref:Uncharacterized protein n=1 Tax=Streptomyces tagetis TaxID=2820809 RepID=A0A941B3V8_9ACTN|nr:hypothetical protein [Streptomyces sp. RG38]MBQ0830726.1 hypothetical protein [Streptomyces sp. RG38]
MLCGVVAVTLSACDPGGLGSASVAYTTDRTVTRELDRQQADVRWLSCTATAQDTTAQDTIAQDGTGASTPAGERAAASVDCRGRTGDGRDITVSGQVTRVVDGVCVRGDLSAEVGGERLFRVAGLGDCDATTAPPAPPAQQPQAPQPPAQQPPALTWSPPPHPTPRLHPRLHPHLRPCPNPHPNSNPHPHPHRDPHPLVPRGPPLPPRRGQVADPAPPAGQVIQTPVREAPPLRRLKA